MSKLSYFMRKELLQEEIIEVPGPETIKDENGNVVQFKVKKLRLQRVNEIFNNYKKTEVYMDKKRKRPLVEDGKVVMKETKDNAKALRHVIVEALVYPDLKDPELMEFYHCVDATEMPLKAFTNEEYGFVTNLVSELLGITEKDDDSEDEGKTQDEADLEDAKN